MKKKVIGIMLAAAMAATAISGCGNNGGDSSDKKVSNDTATESKDDKVTISLWHIWPEGNGGPADSFAQTLEQMKEEFPEVNFEVDAVADSGDSYKTKIKTAIAGGEAPDIFFTWGGGFSKNFIESGNVLCLDDYVDEETSGKIIEGTTKYFTYDDKLYGLPTRINLGILYCNSDLFKEAGLEYPETVDDLLNCVDKFKEAGYTPMCVGAKDTWTAAMYLNALSIRTAGTEYVNEIVDQKATIDTPEMLESVKLYKELIDRGAFKEGAIALNRDESQTEFLSGKIPMYINGSWLCTNIYDSEVKDSIVVKNVPIVAGGKGIDTEFLGGADQTFMINSETKNPEKVYEVYKFMCEKFSENIYMNGVGVPTWKGDYDTSKIENKLIVDVANMYQGCTGMSLWWDTALPSELATEHLDLVTDLFLGNVTPEDFIAKHKEFLE